MSAFPHCCMNMALILWSRTNWVCLRSVMQRFSGIRNCLIFSIVLPHDTLSPMDTIVFTGGGTGGHIFPGLAIVEIITEKYPHIQCVWFGSSAGMDRNLVESAGLTFYGIP